MFGTTEAKEYKKIKAMYERYLSLYRQINGGSTEGATQFNEFYIRYTYIGKYADHRVLLRLGAK